MPLGFDPVHPGGMDENSPAFQRWERGFVVSSPEGTAEWVRYRPSLRDLSPRASTPSVETLGYSRLSPGTGTAVSLKCWQHWTSVCWTADFSVALVCQTLNGTTLAARSSTPQFVPSLTRRLELFRAVQITAERGVGDFFLAPLTRQKLGGDAPGGHHENPVAQSHQFREFA